MAIVSSVEFGRRGDICSLRHFQGLINVALFRGSSRLLARLPSVRFNERIFQTDVLAENLPGNFLRKTLAATFSFMGSLSISPAVPEISQRQ